MSNYLTVQEVKDRMDRTVAALYNDDGSPNDDWIADDIETVEGVINAHLAVRYATPVQSGADLGLLRGLGLDLIMEVAYRRKPSANVPDALQQAADRARQLLQQIAKGELSLGAAANPETKSAVQGSIVVEGNDPQMTREKLKGF